MEELEIMTLNRSKPSTLKRARILIVDDHQAVREGLASRLSSQPDMEVCGEAADVAESLSLVATTKPDVAIIDIGLKAGDGLDLIKRIKARNPAIRMLVLSMYDESLYAERSLKAGALGYINKENATDKIIEAVRRVLEGRIYLSDQMANHVMNRTGREMAERLEKPDVDVLSDRELEVFKRIGQGLKTDQISEIMHLSPKTIETYRARIKEKLKLGNDTELIQRAVPWTLESGHAESDGDVQGVAEP
jgi:DNA-binding NarL/FixJ family response regulator